MSNMSPELFEQCRPMYVGMCNVLKDVDDYLTEWECEFVNDIGDKLIDCPTLSDVQIQKLTDLYNNHKQRYHGDPAAELRAD